MNNEALEQAVTAMMMKGKGLLAMDESNRTCAKRFEEHGIKCTDDTRREFRQLLVFAPGLEEYVSGAILFDETIRQHTSVGVPMRSVLSGKGILPGIKVDEGTSPLAPGSKEKNTNGLEGLEERLAEYAGMDATFSKWRAVITIGDGMPSEECISTNAGALARYAVLSQKAGIVPVMEPEVLLDGNHSIEECYSATARILDATFEELAKAGGYLPGAILKTGMVLPGVDNEQRAGSEKIAEQTIRCLMEHVPSELGGVVFLSGGQADEEAAERLNAISLVGKTCPWQLTFSYSRAIQRPALEVWAQDRVANVAQAQQALVFRARMCSLASQGKYYPDLENKRPY